MKHLHSLAVILLMAVAAPLLSSCLGDDDNDNDNQLVVFTQAGKVQALQQIAGTYTTSLSYKDGTTGSATWRISTDSTIVCSPFPMKVLVNALSSSYPTQSEILSKAESQTLTGIVHPLYSYGSTMVLTTEYAPISFAVGEGTDAHTVSIKIADKLTINNTAAESCLYYASQQIQATILFDKITIDGTDYNLNNGLMLTGKKQ